MPPRSEGRSSGDSSRGDLLGVTATDALRARDRYRAARLCDLGRPPGTVASLRQQWGRAGRRDSGLAVLIASEDALDQFFMREPDALLSRRVEAAILDHANPRVLDGHVRAAAFEARSRSRTAAFSAITALERGRSRRSRRAPTHACRTHVGRPRLSSRTDVRLRSTDPDAVVVEREGGQVLGIVEAGRACSTVREGAIYLHLGGGYRVLSLDLLGRLALVEEFKAELLHPDEARDGHVREARSAASDDSASSCSAT